MTREVCISQPGGLLVLRPIHERAIRVRFVPTGAMPEKQSVTLVSPGSPAFTSEESPETVEVKTEFLRTLFNRCDNSLTFFDAHGRLLLREIAGTRKAVPLTVQGASCFWVEQAFNSSPEECLHGLGQFQDGHFNLKGHTRKLVQVNTQISIPFLLSNQGYGLLWHQYGLTEFNPCENPVVLERDLEEGPQFSITVTGSTGVFTDSCQLRTYHGEINLPADGDYGFFVDYGEMTNRHLLKIDGKTIIHQENFWLPPAASARANLSGGTHRVEIIATKGEPVLFWRVVKDTMRLRSPHAEALDYIVFAGPNPNDIIASFRDVSGAAPLLPRWAYGFWQCRERYETQDELLENAQEYRARGLPVDAIVQDWQYWPKEQWAGMVFDPDRFPDPSAMVARLRTMNMHLVLSVWENVSKNCDLGREYEAAGHYVANSPWLDMTNPTTRAAHWAAMEKRLTGHGIAGWWLDATEPENDALAGKRTSLGPGELHRLTYPLYVSQAVFEGQRAAMPHRRVCILSRSSYPGQQRYNSITWSGDIGGDWDAFRRQIVAGLNYCATGLPYWTTDIGGFFRPDNQYTSPAYRELLTRWFQFGAFNPIFRVHGFGSKTEIWRYGMEFEAAARLVLELRYRLMPYIYSTAWQVASQGATFMRPLLMDFRTDPRALAAEYQFCFGQAILVAPVTKPGVDAWIVYLPAETDWIDFWCGERHRGGKYVSVAASIDRLPIFVRAGSILILGPHIQHCGANSSGRLEVRIYSGADAEFTLYEDEGDGYAYENGAAAITRITWNETTRKVTIGASKGSYPGMPPSRHIRLVRVSPGSGVGGGEAEGIEITYQGFEITCAFP